MDRAVKLTRQQLAQFVQAPETIRALENLSLNADDLATTVGQIQGAPILSLEPTDAFTNERVVATDGNVITTDGGPAGFFTFGLSDTGVTEGNYGGETFTLRLSVDEKGRVRLVQAIPLDSDNVSEGLVNLFFTTARARSSISAVDPIGYDATSGTISLNKVLTDGAYAPILTNIANISSSTAYDAQWLRLGSTVTVSGKVDLTPAAGGTLCRLGISLPVASNIAGEYQVAGTAAEAALTAAISGPVIGDAANDRAELQMNFSNTTARGVFWQFTYRVA